MEEIMGFIERLKEFGTLKQLENVGEQAHYLLKIDDIYPIDIIIDDRQLIEISNQSKPFEYTNDKQLQYLKQAFAEDYQYEVIPHESETNNGFFQFKVYAKGVYFPLLYIREIKDAVIAYEKMGE